MKKIKSRLQKLFPYISIMIFLFSFSGIASYTHLFLEKEISRALDLRDDYFKKVGIKYNVDVKKIAIPVTSKERSSLQKKLEYYIDSSNSWYHFLSGVTTLYSSSGNSVSSFNKALECSQNNPGLMWALFIEFHRIGEIYWEERCLKDLDKYFLSSGAMSAPVISQQLLFITEAEEKKGNNKEAEVFYDWSVRFEHYPFWQAFKKSFGLLPRHPIKSINKINECFGILFASWSHQLTLLYNLYNWLRYAVIIFIFITFIILMIENLPTALHRYIDFFPMDVNRNVRFFLTAAMFFSLAVFGIIPFLLFTSLMLWSSLKNNRKVFLGVSVFLLLISPVNARIQEMFRSSISPDNSIGLFQRAIYEGWHVELENAIMENLGNNSTDYLSNLSAAIITLKRNDIISSVSNIKKCMNLNFDDPVMLITAGNIYFSAGKLKKAKELYEKCLEIYPDNETVLFNLGHVNLSLMNAYEGTNQMAKAAESKNGMVSSFIENNDLYFSESWPLLRQFIQPDYKPAYFWKHVFPSHNGSWKSTGEIWKPLFFGIPPLIFLFVSFLVLVLLTVVKIKSPIKNIAFCKLCEKPMCKKCRKGPHCKECFEIVETIDNKMLTKRIKLRIKSRTLLIRKLTALILNILFPGAGSIYRKKETKIEDILLLIGTSFIYATYTAVFTFRYSYPLWIIKNCFIAVFLFLLIYSVLFAIRPIKTFVNETKKIGGVNVS